MVSLCEEEIRTQTHTWGGVAAMRGWGQAWGRCTHRPRAAGECREPGVGQRARPPSEPPVGADLLLRPRFWTSSPQNCEGNFCCFKPPKSRRWELTQSVWCHNDPPPPRPTARHSRRLEGQGNQVTLPDPQVGLGSDAPGQLCLPRKVHRHGTPALPAGPVPLG